MMRRAVSGYHNRIVPLRARLMITDRMRSPSYTTIIAYIFEIR
jgi:hypothetical protein